MKILFFYRQGRIVVGTLIASTLFMHFSISAWAQLSSWYEPSIAISSGLSFSDKMAEESAVWFRNSVRITRGESSPLYVCANFGYAHRSYLLDYYSPLLEPSASGITYRNAFVLQLGLEVRFKNIRKLRKVMHPFAGVFHQQQFYRLSNEDQAAREYFKLDGYKLSLWQIVLEVGSDFVFEKWPRFYFSFQIDPAFFNRSWGREGYVTITDKYSSETQKYDIYYHHQELPCVSLFLGMRF